MIAIVAADLDWGIGKAGALLAHISEDLQRFRALTLGKTVVYGRKTLATFPRGAPLAGRRNLVLSRTLAAAPVGAELCRSLEELAERLGGEEAIVIGGGELYRALLPQCESVLVTRILGRFGADTFFPNLDADPGFVCTQGKAQAVGDLGFRYDKYVRVMQPSP